MKKLLNGLLSIVLLFGFAGCKQTAGTIDGASDEEAAEHLGQIDAPETEEELNEFIDSIPEKDSK